MCAPGRLYVNGATNVCCLQGAKIGVTSAVLRLPLFAYDTNGSIFTRIQEAKAQELKSTSYVDKGGCTQPCQNIHGITAPLLHQKLLYDRAELDSISFVECMQAGLHCLYVAQLQHAAIACMCAVLLHPCNLKEMKDAHHTYMKTLCQLLHFGSLVLAASAVYIKQQPLSHNHWHQLHDCDA